MCTKCKTEYPSTLEYFYKSKQYKCGLQSNCKNCCKERTLKWQKENPEKYKKYKKSWREKNRGWALKKKFGISLEEYNQMLEKQNHRCAICGRHESEFKRKLDVDHDHETGKNRGLLCNNCNTNLGHYEKWYKNYEKSIVKYLKS